MSMSPGFTLTPLVTVILYQSLCTDDDRLIVSAVVVVLSVCLIRRTGWAVGCIAGNNQLVMIPVQVKCISGNTLVSVTGITLVIDRLFVLNELSLE